MKQEYIQQVGRALHLPGKQKREVLRDLEELFASAAEHGETEALTTASAGSSPPRWAASSGCSCPNRPSRLSHIEKALGPEKIPERRVAEALDQLNGPAQARSLVKGGKPVVDRTPFRVETVGHRDGFQQGGFPRAVLAGKKGDD